MKPNNEIPFHSVQLFEPDADALYDIDTAGHLTQAPRRLIAIYCKHGLVSPVVGPGYGGLYFNDEGIRKLRFIESLRTVCGINPAGIKMILHLMNEVESLRLEARFLRGQ